MDLYSEAVREAVRSDLQAENARLRAQALRLAEEKRGLERLCKEAMTLVVQDEDGYTVSISGMQEWTERLCALLEQEGK